MVGLPQGWSPLLGDHPGDPAGDVALAGAQSYEKFKRVVRDNEIISRAQAARVVASSG